MRAGLTQCTILIQEYTPNQKLSYWVHKQRVSYQRHEQGKESYITEKRIELLNKIGFTWEVPSAKWEKKFWELLEFKKKVCLFYSGCLHSWASPSLYSLLTFLYVCLCHTDFQHRHCNVPQVSHRKVVFF